MLGDGGQGPTEECSQPASETCSPDSGQAVSLPWASVSLLAKWQYSEDLSGVGRPHGSDVIIGFGQHQDYEK